jgi:uncharacterized protein YqkB
MKFEKGAWIITKSKKYGKVVGQDKDPIRLNNYLIMFFGDQFGYRSYNPKGLTLVDKSIADILEASYYQDIKEFF